MEGDLRLRLTVAAIGVPLCAMVVYAGGVILALGLGLVAGVGYWEYAAMLRDASAAPNGTAGRGPSARPFAVSGSVGAGLLPLTYLFFGPGGCWALAMALALAYGVIGLARVPVADGPVRAAALTTFGALYIGGLLTFGVPLREVPPLRDHDLAGVAVDRLGATLLFFFPVVVTWLADTAAYAFGRSFGRRKLAPIVSPNKTVEGAVAALVAGPIVSFAYARWVIPGSWFPGTGWAVAFGVLVAAAAILGDLFESALKRECAVKDSSGLLPGHGGLLDRLDSLLWAIPAAYLLLTLPGT